MNTTRLNPCNCPKCAMVVDAATDPTNQGETPSPGDITICFYCETLLEFDDNMTLSEIDITALDLDVQDAIIMATAQIQAVKAGRTIH